MDFFSVLTMLGALALFLYGMKIMGDSLSVIAGGRLEEILEKMTNTPLKAVILGAGVTAIIQSSSATTVMVVGFVNSGIMKLNQAVGIIMGANIGTTVTSWILSLTGIESGNFLIKLLKPSSFSPVLALIGIYFILFAKSKKKQDIGTIMIGFAILMFGMETMSNMAKPLATIPSFTKLFIAFENPLLGMAAGALLTAIIQSSSASVGILQAMCITKAVTFGSAIPIIMGQNIGTCVTALLSGIGASRNARRASLVHLYFNLIGTVLFMVVFYGLNTVFKFSFLSGSASASSIAIIHSIFNILATLVLLPASKIIERLSYLTVPVLAEEKEEKSNRLDDRFLEHASFAVSLVKSECFNLARLVEEGMKLCVKLSTKFNEEIYDRVVEIEDDVDKRQDELNVYIAKISSNPLSEKDSLNLARYRNWITDLERISDYEKGLAITFKENNKHSEVFSVDARKEEGILLEAASEIVESTIHCIIHEDKYTAIKIEALSDVISVLKEKVKKNHETRFENGECSIKLGISLNDIISSIDRIGGHCSNIAEDSIHEDDYSGQHQVASYRRRENEVYKEFVDAYKKMFNI